MNILPKLFVGNIGLKSITICGEHSKKYLVLPNTEFARNSVLIDFENEDSMLLFLQKLINESIPFQSTYKNDPARDAVLFRNKGKLNGDIISFGWSSSGATYKTE